MLGRLERWGLLLCWSFGLAAAACRPTVTIPQKAPAPPPPAQAPIEAGDFGVPPLPLAEPERAAFREPWRDVKAALVSQMPPQPTEQSAAVHTAWLASEGEAWRVERGMRRDRAVVALRAFQARYPGAEVAVLGLTALMQETMLRDFVLLPQPRGAVGRDVVGRAIRIERAAPDLQAALDGYAKCNEHAARAPVYAEWARFCSEHAEVLARFAQTVRSAAGLDSAPAAGAAALGTGPGPDPGGPAACWAAPPARRAPRPSRAAPTYVVRLPSGGPFVTAERERLRELLLATLASDWSLSTLPLDATRGIEARHARALGAAHGPGCSPELDAVAELRAIAREPLLATTELTCWPAHCQLAMRGERGQASSTTPGSLLMSATASGNPLAPETLEALAAGLHGAAGRIGFAAPSFAPRTRSAVELPGPAERAYFGDWNRALANLAIDELHDALRACPVSAPDVDLGLVLDVAPDGSVRAVDRAQPLPLTASQTATFDCVQRALSALRFPVAESPGRRIAIGIDPATSATPDRDAKYGGLDGPTRVRVRLPALADPPSTAFGPTPAAELQSAIASCYRKLYGETQTGVLAVQLRVQPPRAEGPVRYTFDVKQSPDPRTHAALGACLQQATAAIAWPCATANAPIVLNGLACAFGESAPPALSPPAPR